MSRSAASSSSGVMQLHSRSPCPSSAISQPAASTRRRSRRAVDQDRIGVVDVDVDAPLAKPGERRERAVRPVDRHVAHAAAGLLAGAGRIISSSVNSVPSNKTTSARASRSRSAGVTAAAPGTKTSRAPPARELDADIGAVSLAVSGLSPFEVERHLARHREQLRRDAAGQLERRAAARPLRASPGRRQARRTSGCRASAPRVSRRRDAARTAGARAGSAGPRSDRFRRR